VVTPLKVSLTVFIFLGIYSSEIFMAGASLQQKEWVDDFLFVGNQLALDFLNTKPILRAKLGNSCRMPQRWNDG